MKRRRHFSNISQLAIVEPIEEMSIAAVAFIECPSLDFDAVCKGIVDQLQCDLRFRQKSDIVGNMSFFRRVGSSAQSLGKYIRAAMRH